MRTILTQNRERYAAASSPEAFEIALQSLRVATQYHLMVVGEQSRDESMAENTIWVADQLGPESRLVVWAHNFHVSTQPGAQGFYMRPRFGEDMIVLGFSHEAGRFIAWGQDGDTYTGLSEFQLDPVEPLSFEHYASTVTHERFFLDLRGRDPAAEETSWLFSSRPFRSIGAVYDPGTPESFWWSRPVASWYDVMIHYAWTRPTTVLEARYVDGF